MRIRLTQTTDGKPLGADPATETEVIAELSDNFAHYTQERQYLLISEDIAIWGSYKLRDSNGYLLPKTSWIGRKHPGSGSFFKIWGYNPKSSTIHFLTISTDHVTGGGDRAPDQAEMEMELNNAQVASGKVKYTGTGTRNGHVRNTNDQKAPFHVGTIFWEPR